ncbi:metal-dependent hydrolase family protein [Nitrospirillum iridis]|uniref:Imidazolonepropionase-like amidohydrolase n=1 Tax=Nitrospirillum iridis TaxID=765888 RepID=A0A7X0B002_9PROT|nr:amidohydrolase family protein [Nitrospirillum iridis]MBB6252160.1 imidazolonepropionase-like amidohydrolase [Nitrospirillum iridis]
MGRRLLAAALMSTALGGAAMARAEPVPAQDSVIYAGALIDGVTFTPRRQVTIVVHEGKVTAVEAGYVAHPGVPVIDMKDQTVLPGLIDCHVHISAKLPSQGNAVEDMMTHTAVDAVLDGAIFARAMLLQGFTSARDVGGGDDTVSLRNAIDAGKVPGPRLWVSLEPLGPTGGHGDPSNGFDSRLHHPDWQNGIVDTPDMARLRVREHHKRGATVIKIMPSGGIASTGDDPRAQLMTNEEIKAAIDTAHSLGLKVAAHTYPSQAIINTVNAGVDSIEHGSFADADAVKAMKTHGTYLVPTLTVYDVFMKAAQEHPELLPPGTAEKELANDAIPKRNLPLAYKAGVKIAYGTDIGEGDHAREFALLAEAGVTPADALLFATRNAADLIGATDRIGTVQAGRYADLIAVAGDPLAHLELMEQVRFVMKGGVVYKADGHPVPPS